MEESTENWEDYKARIAREVDEYHAEPSNNPLTLLDNNTVSYYAPSSELASNRTKNAQKTHNFGIDDVRQYIQSQGFRYWEIRNLDYELGIVTAEDRHYRRRLIGILLENNEIEQHPHDGKKYRQVSQNSIIDYKNAVMGKPLDLWLPFDIHRYFVTHTGNLIAFAGVTDSGKTALAINIIRNNDEKWTIDYWTNEVSAGELMERLELIEPEKDIGDWNFKAEEITPSYKQKIRPDILSIFDYIDVGDPYYQIAEEHQAIRNAIGDGVGIVFLQKDEARLLGRGKGFSAQLPRLYISMTMNSAYAYKAKTPRDPNNPLKGKTCEFTLKNGVDFSFTDWNYKGVDFSK